MKRLYAPPKSARRSAHASGFCGTCATAEPDITNNNATRNNLITTSWMLWKGNTQKVGVIHPQGLAPEQQRRIAEEAAGNTQCSRISIKQRSVVGVMQKRKDSILHHHQAVASISTSGSSRPPIRTLEASPISARCRRR